MSIFLGIDPGSHNTGFGLIEKNGSQIRLLKYGAITAKTSLSFEDRLLFIGKELEKILQDYRPQDVIIEEIFTAKNVKSSLQLAHVRGACVYLAKGVGAQVHTYSAKSVKKGITGNGAALKDQVALVLEGLLSTRISVEKLDATDALALAYYHASRVEVLERFGVNHHI